MRQAPLSQPPASGHVLSRQFILILFCTVALSSAVAQTTNTLVPSSCVSTQSSFVGTCASIGNTPLQTGTGNTPSDEIVLQGLYTGYQVFNLPTSVSPSSITNIQVKVNYQGPSYSRQVWTWQLFNWSTNSYVTVGNNSAITPPLDWVQWTVFNFTVPGTLANYVRASDGQMRVQIFSNNAVDDTYIDYEAVVVTSSASSVNVSVSPTSATLIGGATQQFNATVTGNSNTAVTWSLTGSGTLSSSGLYTAPATVANVTTATVKATSVAETTKSASATVTINPVTVSVSPTSVSLGAGGTQQFTATVANDGGKGVTWSLAGAGTLSSTGLYTAPASISGTSTATVTATSIKDGTKSASATVTLTPASVAISPTSATLGGGGSQQFTATVTGTANTAVTWSLSGLGTLSTSGLYSAPASVSSQSTSTVTATLVVDTTKSASANVTLNPVSVAISPTSASVATAATQQFTATVSYSTNTAVTWQVNGVTGGNSTVGTISAAGLYTAPSAVPNPATVTVKAISQADTTKSASASVTVTAASGIPSPLHGVTLTDDNDVRTSYLNGVLPALANMSVTPTVRLLYTVGANASTYVSAVQSIKNTTVGVTGAHPYVMGMPVDSDYMCGYTRTAHQNRWNDYVNGSTYSSDPNNLATYNDVWEVGNEINGDWLCNSGTGCSGNGSACKSGGTTTVTDVANKVTDAFNIVKAAGKKAALTLTFCPTDLPAANQPFTWLDNYLTNSTVRHGMDYVLISYYYVPSSQCAYGDPTAQDWINWFNGIEQRFPNAKVGMGEWGWCNSCSGRPSNLSSLLQEGYSINPSASLTNPSAWTGGVFYWEFGSTAVPYTGTAADGSPSDWNDVNTDLLNQH